MLTAARPCFAALAMGIVWLALPSSAAAQAPDPAPQRVVSLSVCADQFLVAFADPRQVASLSSGVTDRRLSYYADIADRFSHSASTPETLIAYAPDLILVDAGAELPVRGQLERLGYPIVEVDAVTSIDGAIEQVREIAALLGQQDRGEALAAIIDSARRQATRTNWGATAIAFRDGGFVPGHQTLMSDLLGVIGLNNIGEALSGGDGRVPLEVLIASPPDYLVVPEEDPNAGGQSLALLSHPALIEIFPPARRLLLPDRLTYCGGPSIPEALRWLASELERVTP